MARRRGPGRRRSEHLRRAEQGFGEVVVIAMDENARAVLACSIHAMDEGLLIKARMGCDCEVGFWVCLALRPFDLAGNVVRRNGDGELGEMGLRGAQAREAICRKLCRVPSGRHEYLLGFTMGR